MTLSQNTVV